MSYVTILCYFIFSLLELASTAFLEEPFAITNNVIVMG